MAYTTLKDHWANHYARAIENQLDVVHLPFVHHNTIGRGNRTLANGPLAREESHWAGDHLINLWVYNEVDRGQKPKKPSELPEPTRHPLLQFRYGNLWHNWIADNIRIVIAFAPIDQENTMMYIRFYHTVRAPVLRQLFGWMGALANLVIERQDRRVVVTQRPPRPDLGIGEILIQGTTRLYYTARFAGYSSRKQPRKLKRRPERPLFGDTQPLDLRIMFALPPCASPERPQWLLRASFHPVRGSSGAAGPGPAQLASARGAYPGEQKST